MAKTKAKEQGAVSRQPSAVSRKSGEKAGGIDHVLFASKGFESISRRIVNADGANDVEGGLRCLATQTELWGAEAAKVLKRRAERNDG